MRRRILLLITDLEIGGTPTVVRELALRLRKPGEVEIEVASLRDLGPVGAALAASGVHVTALNATSAFSLPVVVRRLRKLIRERGIDTVASFLVHANVVAALAGMSGIRWLQSIQTTQQRPRWHWVAQQWAASRAEIIFVPSPSVAEIASDRSGISADKLIVIPNAVDPRDFARSAIPTSPPSIYPIGFIGRLDPVKRIVDACQAVEPLTDHVVLHVFGDGPERTRIEGQNSRGGWPNLVLHGAVSRPQDALWQIGLLVLPSEAEGFGLVLIEAMAAGVPIVATNAPGIRDVVRHDFNGLLVPVGDVSALRSAIERAVTNRDLRLRLIQNGLRTVREKFSWDVVLPRYRALLKLG